MISHDTTDLNVNEGAPDGDHNAFSRKLFVEAAAGGEVVVEHGLGRVPLYFLITEKDAACDAYWSKDTDGTIKRDSRQCVLKFTAQNVNLTIRFH